MGPSRIIKSSSWPCAGDTPKSHNTLPESVIQKLIELRQAGAVTTALTSLFQCCYY